MKKIVNIKAVTPIRGVAQITRGSINGIEMSTEDIFKCLCQGATVVEVIGSSTVVLNTKNYNKNNAPAVSVASIPTKHVIPVAKQLVYPTAVKADVEETTAKETKVEEPIVEEAPVEEVITEEAKVEEQVEEKVEEPVAEETPVEEATTEETNVEEKVEDVVSDETASTEETNVEEPVAEETTSDTDVKRTNTNNHRRRR